MKRHHMLCLAAGAILIGSRVFGGSVIVFETSEPGTPESTTQTLSIQGHNLHMSAGMGDGYTIFRGDRDVFWHVQPSRRTYMEMDKESLAQMGQAMSEAMKKMQERLAQMPAEQRAMVESMMPKNMQPAAAPKQKPVTLNKTGTKSTINGFPCTRYTVTREGETVAELWVTPLSRAGLPQEDFAAFKNMAAFMEELMKQLPQTAETALARELGYDQLDGFPIVTRTYTDGNVDHEMRCTGIEPSTLDAALFDIPSGYRKQEMGIGR